MEGTAASDPQGGVETAHGAAGIRVLVSFAAGIAAFAIAWLATPWQAAALIGWNVAATVFIAWIWFTVAGMDAEATARHAAIEDLSRPTADLTLILASVASLVGVGLSLLGAYGSRITARTMGLHPALAFAAARLGGLIALPAVAPRSLVLAGPCYRRHRLTLNQPDGERGWTREPRVYGAHRDVVTFGRRRRARRLITRLLPQDGRSRGRSYLPKGVAHFRRCGLSAIHRSPPDVAPADGKHDLRASDEGRRESKARRQRERVGSMGGNHG